MNTVRFVSKNEVKYDKVSFIPTNDGDELVSKIKRYRDSLLFFHIECFEDNLLNSMLGFQSKNILKVLSENSETSYMTGSFILWILQGMTHNWYPGDIDIFTTDEHFHEKLNKAFNNKLEMYKSSEPKYEFVNSTNQEKYLPERTHILNIYEWKTKDPDHKRPQKLQVIVVKGDVNDVINKFDFDIVKAKYNGQRLYIPEATLDCLLEKKTTMISKYSTISELKHSINRSIKYTKRGFCVNYPKELFVDSVVNQWNLSPDIMKLYHTTKQNNTLILNDNYQPKVMFNEILGKISLCKRDIYLYGFDFDLISEFVGNVNYNKLWNIYKGSVCYPIEEGYYRNKRQYLKYIGEDKSTKQSIEIFYDTFELSQLEQSNNDNQIKTYENILKEIADKVSFINIEKISKLEERIKELEEENSNLRKVKGDIMNLLTK